MTLTNKSNILIINGHPDSASFNAALADAYATGALGSGAQVRRLNLAELAFNPILSFGYRKRTELEPDLIRAQELIRWAHHLVFVYPTWWGAMPALLKGFIDRVFLPGFAFKYRENSALWDKLLVGRTAHLLVTMDTPSWYNRLVYRNAGHIVMKKNILKFCGINPVRITELTPIKPSTPEQRAKWLKKAKTLGEKMS
ncbi:NADPH:quinone reductase [Paenibacillus agaridevorans]|jgi:NAD(P)H dehydrogenase (quinone)|uniref:NADPH:quinone reductase n=1 Tax=Paenibacillus agaridevorans TaxID=171404 RepID=A0A2R5F625_9BACL|nr:NAD(P)H-dependent oxidoreductase [Paenibacillus agaridevorans]GBG12373.1 NADPH:quinone reductase [Paenibacillus agaridevorans]